MSEVLYRWQDAKGKTFEILGNIQSIRQQCEEYLAGNMHDEDDEYYLGYCQSSYDKHPTEDERNADIAALKSLLDSMENESAWNDIQKQLTFKKNGTLHKRSTHEFWLGNTFAHLWEDSYGYNTPYVRVQNINDYQAEIQVGSRVVKW